MTAMINSFIAPVLNTALKKLSELVKANCERGARTLIFCEDRLTLAAERTVCAAVGGSFTVNVCTFARFLAQQRGKQEGLLTRQGSAMIVRSLIQNNRDRLTAFKKLSSATAAQDIYDTIALLYSSRVTPEDIAAANCPDPVLRAKLEDLAFLYAEYVRFLEDSGSVDRNRYMALLPEVITASPEVRGADVIFLGFQAFTCSVAECAAACMEAAKNVTGIFIGGAEDVYTNQAPAYFSGVAKAFGGVNTAVFKSTLRPEAESIRTHIFDPQTFHTAAPAPTSAVKLFCGADEDEEMEYVVANIIRYVFEEGVRYRSISVMLPDTAKYAPALARVFGEYGIPFYLDRRYRLSEHPVCTFLAAFLSCAADGCTAQSVMAAVSSPLFFVAGGGAKPAGEGERRKDKDLFANYVLRLAGYRGGVKRTPKKEVLDALKLDICAVERIRTPFLKALKGIPANGTGAEYCAALRGILEQFCCRERLEGMSAEFAADYPAEAAFCGRAYDAVCAVLDEAEKLTSGTRLAVRDFAGILKSGFAAAELSLIPPKQDAVFAGDLTACANTGSEVVFAVGLTDGVPAAGDDTAVLTDRDLASLEGLDIKISPKIAEVDMRRRETAGLNLCAFERALHLSRPLRSGGEETGASPMLDYVCALFASPSGAPLSPLTGRDMLRDPSMLKYLCSRPAPALRQMAASPSPAVRSAIYSMLCDNGFADGANGALAAERGAKRIDCGAKLYGTSFSPTVLESYFSCPYKCFMMRGLRLAEREEGVMRPLDSGNFIHAVLQSVFAPDVNDLTDADRLAAKAKDAAERLLKEPKYSALSADKRGEYAARALIEECADICAGAFEQLKNSRFAVAETERVCRLTLDGGLSLHGRIDRVDVSGDMVRIIDYKTGSADSAAPLYYMGLKLQLPIYLLAAAKGRRAVGAYYFPASVTYESERDGVFRLSGYMDCSDEVMLSTQKDIAERQKSIYVNAYYRGQSIDSALPEQEFGDFLKYSSLVARRGAAEMKEGNVAPSPAPEACAFCALAGSCGFAAGINGEYREKISVNCRGIAGIVRRERGDEE